MNYFNHHTLSWWRRLLAIAGICILHWILRFISCYSTHFLAR